MAVGVVQKADLFHLAVNNGNDVWKVLTLPPGSGNELTKLSSPINNGGVVWSTTRTWEVQ